MTEPLVSMIMPVHNREHFAAVAIDSVLAQTLSDFEFIIVDDGSTDGTPALLEQYRDPRLRVVTQPRNLGAPAARNRAIALARGRYIAMIDSDDWAYPRRLERQVAFLQSHPDIALAGTWSRVVDEAGRPLDRLKRQPSSPEAIQARLLFRCCISHRSVMACREVLTANPYREDFIVSQDFELFARLARSHRLGNLPEVLMAARAHGGRISTTKTALIKEMNIAVIDRQLTELGLAPTAADAERHFLLTRSKLLGPGLDPSFLDWAASWLAGIEAAGQRTRRYDPAALRRVCGEIWFELCRHAARRQGNAAWRRLWRSPLRVAALAALAGRATERATEKTANRLQTRAARRDTR